MRPPTTPRGRIVGEEVGAAITLTPRCQLPEGSMGEILKREIVAPTEVTAGVRS